MSERPTLASVTAIGLEQATLPFVSDAQAGYGSATTPAEHSVKPVQVRRIAHQ